MVFLSMFNIPSLASAGDQFIRIFPGANAAIWITSGEPFAFVTRQSMSEICYLFPVFVNDFNRSIRCPVHGVQGVGGSNPLIPTRDFKGLGLVDLAPFSVG
jgi:hypothetical protein